MPIDPHVKLLAALAGRAATPDSSVPFATRRTAAARQYYYFRWVALRRGPKVASISHVSVPVAGGRINVRIYRPYGGETLPLHVFFHGGGFCMGTLDERDNGSRGLAVDAACVVASVEYRLAPENQYPTLTEDCYAALCWLVEHAAELDVNPEAVSVGGESAGGTDGGGLHAHGPGPQGADSALPAARRARDRHHHEPPLGHHLRRGLHADPPGDGGVHRRLPPRPALATEPYASPSSPRTTRACRRPR